MNAEEIVLKIQFFLLITDKYPEGYADDGSLIFIQTGFESRDLDSEIISFDELRFMTTVLVNFPGLDTALNEIKTWWRENVGGDLKLERLATEVSHLHPTRAKNLDRLKRGEWSIRSGFIAYCADSKVAYEEARELIYESELLTQNIGDMGGAHITKKN